VTKRLYILGSIVCIVAAPRAMRAQAQPLEGTVVVSFSVLPVEHQSQDAVGSSGARPVIHARSSSTLSQIDSPGTEDRSMKVTYGVSGISESIEAVAADARALPTTSADFLRELTEAKTQKYEDPVHSSNGVDRLVVITITD